MGKKGGAKPGAKVVEVSADVSEADTDGCVASLTHVCVCARNLVFPEHPTQPFAQKLAAPGCACRDIATQVRKQVDALRSTASQHYLKKDYNASMSAFTEAMTLLPENAPERFDCMQKRTFCLMNMKK